MMDPSDDEMAAWPDEVRWALEKADGFLDLHLPARARRELDHIPEAARDTAPYRRVALRWAIETRDWAAAAELAEWLRRGQPMEAEFWILKAFAVRRAVGLEAARRVLEEATPRFPKLAVIPFNRACYECCLGRHEEAMKLLQQAFSIDPSYRDVAQEDEDLEPLWDKLGGGAAN